MKTETDLHLPTDPATGRPLAASDQPGYYQGYDILSQQAYWDEATRRLVLKRVDEPPPIRYFDAQQTAFWRCVFDHLLPQDDRTRERRIPVLETVDAHLYENRGVGYRYANMPPNREAYRLGQQAIDEEAVARFGRAFLDLSYPDRENTLKAIHDGKPAAARAIWSDMSVGRFWQMLMQDAIDGYYAHPWSWNEIGFGGPAYPRAYTRLERGEPEPWEVAEQRYAWRAPSESASDMTESRQHLHTESAQNDSSESIK